MIMIISLKIGQTQLRSKICNHPYENFYVRKLYFELILHALLYKSINFYL